MEAETYLSSGFGIRTAIEAKSGWTRFDRLAKVWMPGRLKGIQVSKQFGTPFLAATQVFDIRPIPRKWLALDRTSDAASRFVKPGTILVTCSGSVGRATTAYAPHENTLISHDLMRVEPHEEPNRGWLYAYLQASQVRAMLSSSHYGHIIKHLEASHMEALPVPNVDATYAAQCEKQFDTLLRLRNKSHKLSEEADARFARAIGAVEPKQKTSGFTVQVSEFAAGRRRLEATYHTPQAAALLALLKDFDRLQDVTKRIWWMPRFKRYYGEAGIPYLSADELFTVNPQQSKRILVDPDDNHRDYFVQPGWIVMACSGQVYGLNGAAMLTTDAHASTFFSHDLIRIIADDSKIRPGYLLVALTHRTHGRPLLIRAAYGTSIPHLDPNDVADFPIARLSESEEKSIASLAEAAARARAEADSLERTMSQEASTMIDEFLKK